jgi:hypothetical protein
MTCIFWLALVTAFSFYFLQCICVLWKKRLTYLVLWSECVVLQSDSQFNVRLTWCYILSLTLQYIRHTLLVPMHCMIGTTKGETRSQFQFMLLKLLKQTLHFTNCMNITAYYAEDKVEVNHQTLLFGCHWWPGNHIFKLWSHSYLLYTFPLLTFVFL